MSNILPSDIFCYEIFFQFEDGSEYLVKSTDFYSALTYFFPNQMQEKVSIIVHPLEEDSGSNSSYFDGKPYNFILMEVF